jgi:hypothetical protein
MKLFNKFLVRRRDGSVPPWPYFVLGAADPAAPAALRQYALNALVKGMDREYCAQVHLLAARFDDWREKNHIGDPDAVAHREDDPEIVAAIPPNATELPAEYHGRKTYLDKDQQ